jgi:hypothetical protein
VETTIDSPGNFMMQLNNMWIGNTIRYWEGNCGKFVRHAVHMIKYEHAKLCHEEWGLWVKPNFSCSTSIFVKRDNEGKKRWKTISTSPVAVEFVAFF